MCRRANRKSQILSPLYKLADCTHERAPKVKVVFLFTVSSRNSIGSHYDELEGKSASAHKIHFGANLMKTNS